MESYTVVSNEVISNKNIDGNAFCTLYLLAQKCRGREDNICHTSKEQLAKDLQKGTRRVSIKTVEKYLKELIDEGLIEIEYNEDGLDTYHVYKMKSCWVNAHRKGGKR